MWTHTTVLLVLSYSLYSLDWIISLGIRHSSTAKPSENFNTYRQLPTQRLLPIQFGLPTACALQIYAIVIIKVNVWTLVIAPLT